MSAHSSPWHSTRAPYLRRLRLKLESLLGARCAYCGLSRADGVNLQIHHPTGRDYSPHKLSWGQRLHRYRRELLSGVPLTLACDQTGNDCHNKLKRSHPCSPMKLYDYPEAIVERTNEPF